MKPEIVIIPDVHGRSFWKAALPYIEDGTPVVFLGDYLDPYGHEGISPEQALDNFMSILHETEGRNNVTLLLGNHDMTYVAPKANICECRTDYEHLDEIHKLFMQNANRFRFVRSGKVHDTSILFSHAGVHKEWLAQFLPGIQTDIMHDNLEQLQVDQDFWHLFCLRLAQVSSLRGGLSRYGSCVWADIREFDYPTKTLEGYLQIVGHSQQLEYGCNPEFWWKPGKPVRMNQTVCLDCHQCFYVDSEGDIRYLEGDQVVK